VNVRLKNCYKTSWTSIFRGTRIGTLTGEAPRIAVAHQLRSAVSTGADKMYCIITICMASKFYTIANYSVNGQFENCIYQQQLRKSALKMRNGRRDCRSSHYMNEYLMHEYVVYKFSRLIIWSDQKCKHSKSKILILISVNKSI
jgi:hypothetical protein